MGVMCAPTRKLKPANANNDETKSSIYHFSIRQCVVHFGIKHGKITRFGTAVWGPTMASIKDRFRYRLDETCTRSGYWWSLQLCLKWLPDTTKSIRQRAQAGDCHWKSISLARNTECGGLHQRMVSLPRDSETPRVQQNTPIKNVKFLFSAIWEGRASNRGIEIMVNFVPLKHTYRSCHSPS